MKRTYPVRTFRLNWRAVAVCAMVLLVFAALVVPTVVSAQNQVQLGEAVGSAFFGGRTPPPPDPSSPGTQTPEVEGQSSLVASVLTALLEGLISLLGPILTALISGVIWVSSYNDFVNALAVVNGWVVVRDIANMFFIIVLLIIAFGTILGQEDYHYKKLLPKFLLLAILINFSRTIVGVMIDFTQVVMLTFVNGYSAAAGGNFANIFHIVDLLQYKAANCRAGSLSGWSIFGAAALAFIMIVISIITVVVILTVLALRVIMLWLLIVLSPLAFLAGTFPQGQKYYAQWWEEFKNQAMVGPMLAFFLWLSLVTVGGGNAASQLTQNGKPIVTGATDIPFACSAVGSTEAMMSYIIGTMMLLIGVQMSQQMGGAVSGVAMRAKGAAGRALKYGGRALVAPAAGLALLGARRLQRKALNWSAEEEAPWYRKLLKYPIAPAQAVAGFMQRGKKLDEEARQRAFAAAEDDADKVFTLGRIKRYRLRTTKASQRQALAKEFSILGRTEQAELLNSMMGKKGNEAQDYRESLVLSLVSKGYLDDYAETKKKEYAALNKERYGAKDGSFYDDRIAGDILADILTNSEVGKGRAKMLKNPNHYQGQFAVMADLEEAAKQTGHIEVMNHSGEKATEGPMKGRWSGTREQAYKTRLNKETGQKEFIDKEGNATLDPKKFVPIEQLEDGTKIEEAVRTGRMKYDEKEDAYIDSKTKKKIAWSDMDFYNPERIDYATNEAAKRGAAVMMADAPHTVLSRTVDAQGKFGVGWQFTPMQKMGLQQRNKANEQRRLQDRMTEWFLGTDYDVNPEERVLTVESENDLRRLIAVHDQDKAIVPMMYGQATSAEARNFTFDSIKVRVKGTDKEHPFSWVPFGKTPKGEKGAKGPEGGAPEGGGPAGGEGGVAPTQPPPTPPTPPVAPPAAPVAPAPAVPAPRVSARKGGRIRIKSAGRVVDVRGNRVIESVEGQRRKERRIEEISEEEIRRIFGSVSTDELRGKGMAPEVISRVEQVRAAAPAAPAVRPAAPAPAAGAAPATKIPAGAIANELAQSMQEIARQFDRLNIDRDLQNLTRDQERAVKDVIQKVLKAVEKSKKAISRDMQKQIADLSQAMNLKQEKLWNFLRYKGINKYTFPEIMKQFMAGEGSEGGPGGGQNA